MLHHADGQHSTAVPTRCKFELQACLQLQWFSDHFDPQSVLDAALSNVASVLLISCCWALWTCCILKHCCCSELSEHMVTTGDVGLPASLLRSRYPQVTHILTTHRPICGVKPCMYQGQKTMRCCKTLTCAVICFCSTAWACIEPLSMLLVTCICFGVIWSAAFCCTVQTVQQSSSVLQLCNAMKGLPEHWWWCPHDNDAEQAKFSRIEPKHKMKVSSSQGCLHTARQTLQVCV